MINVQALEHTVLLKKLYDYISNTSFSFLTPH